MSVDMKSNQLVEFPEMGLYYWRCSSVEERLPERMRKQKGHRRAVVRYHSSPQTESESGFLNVLRNCVTHLENKNLKNYFAMSKLLFIFAL